jgi:23S rRNA pseudouridine2605 synthase
MEHNLNDKMKRVRKRIVVKQETAFSKKNNTREFPTTEKTERFNSPETSKPERTERPAYNKPFNKSNKPYDPNRNQRFDQKKGPGNSFKKSYNQDPVDETYKHQIFKKHEGKPETIISGEISNRSKDGNELVRLNKFISNAGVCSRREADDLITKGLIKVNGKVIVEMGYKVNPKDVVEYKDRRITEANHVYILLNKPKDTITTTHDPENRLTVMDLVKKATDQRIFPIGRLDRNTTGVLLLTNDGDFAQKLSHPSSEIRKVYYAVLDKPLEREDFAKLTEGVELEDGPMKADKVAYVDAKDKAMIGIEIHSGKNRIIHRMFEHLGYRLKKLDRVVYAGLDKGGLRRSKWRFLRFDEVQTVLNSIKYHDETIS